MNKIVILFQMLALSFAIVLFSCKTQSTYEDVFSNFQNITKPVSFAAELSLKGSTYKGCFSKDYSKFYFFRANTPDAEDYRIFESTFVNHEWGSPTEISFSGSSSDVYPMISTKDANRLFFTSYRRIPSDTSAKPNANFWVSLNERGSWGEPSPFLEANLMYNYNSQPCMTENGNIYFTSNKPDWSQTLTYKMEYHNGVYKNPVLFDPVNKFRESDSTRTIFEICMSPTEDYMILTLSEHRQDTKLFISYLKDASWTNPKYLGDIVDSDMTGNFPYITSDGKFLIFTRHFSEFLILPTKTFAVKN